MEVLDGDFLERLNKYRGTFLYMRIECIAQTSDVKMNKALYLRNIIFLEVSMGVSCFAE